MHEQKDTEINSYIDICKKLETNNEITSQNEYFSKKAKDLNE